MGTEPALALLSGGWIWSCRHTKKVIITVSGQGNLTKGLAVAFKTDVGQTETDPGHTSRWLVESVHFQQPVVLAESNECSWTGIGCLSGREAHCSFLDIPKPKSRVNKCGTSDQDTIAFLDSRGLFKHWNHNVFKWHASGCSSENIVVQHLFRPSWILVGVARGLNGLLSVNGTFSVLVQLADNADASRAESSCAQEVLTYTLKSCSKTTGGLKTPYIPLQAAGTYKSAREVLVNLCMITFHMIVLSFDRKWYDRQCNRWKSAHIVEYGLKKPWYIRCACLITVPIQDHSSFKLHKVMLLPSAYNHL